MKYCNRFYDLSKEYMHPINRKNPPMCSKGVYYANGESKIKESKISKQVGGGINLNNKYYMAAYKSPTYYYDLNNTIGGRPVLLKVETDIPHGLPNNTTFNKDNEYNCSQPWWKPNCY